MNTKTILSVAMTAITVGASAQVNNADRNFQRLDKTPHMAKGATAPVSAPMMGWSAGAGFTFPDAVRSYYFSAIYSANPMGAANNTKALQATLTYDRSIPRFEEILDEDTATPAAKVDGPKSDNVFFTIQYQATPDSNYAITPGFVYTHVGNGNGTAYTPFVAGSYAITNELIFTPTLGWTRITGGGNTTDGWVPDFQVAYYPMASKYAVLADYTVRTRLTFASVMVAGKFDINQRFNVKAGVVASKLTNPAYIFGVYYKF